MNWYGIGYIIFCLFLVAGTLLIAARMERDENKVRGGTLDGKIGGRGER